MPIYRGKTNEEYLQNVNQYINNILNVKPGIRILLEKIRKQTLFPKEISKYLKD